MAQFAGRDLTLAARLLALALACKARRASDGRYYIWRGREALSQLTGLSVRSVTVARRELLEAGLFLATCRESIETPEGVFDVTPGVPVLELVENPAAFLAVRAQARVRDRQIVDDATKFDRIKIQNRCITGQITLDDCRRQEADVRRHYRRDRRAG